MNDWMFIFLKKKKKTTLVHCSVETEVVHFSIPFFLLFIYHLILRTYYESAFVDTLDIRI